MKLTKAPYGYVTDGDSTIFIKNGEAINFISAFTICVLPFIIPDILKIFLALSLSEKINKLIIKKE